MKLREAARFLATVLADGPCAAPDMQREAKAAGLAWRTVERSRERSGVLSEKFDFAAGWQWRFKRDGPNRPALPDTATLADPDDADPTAEVAASPDDAASGVNPATWRPSMFSTSPAGHTPSPRAEGCQFATIGEHSDVQPPGHAA